jgi:hypothetical protein
MKFADRIALAIVISAHTAAAQPVQRSDSNVAAESLFREGKRLMKDNQIAAACEKFEASERLDESVGTLLNLADCREKAGQLATAWADFLKAASVARTAHDGSRETEARSRARTLEPRLSYLTISVPDANRIEGLVIKRDETTIDQALWNQGVPVDPGSYQISGQAPGHEPWSTKVQIRGEGQKASVEVPRLKELQALGKDLAPKAVPALVPDRDEAEEERPAPRRGLTPLRKSAIPTAAVGVASIAVGIGFGLHANSLAAQSNAICPGTTCGDTHALDLNRSAHRDAIVGDVLFGVGGAAVAGAVVLWVVGAPPKAADAVTFAPVVGPGVVGLAFGRAL